MDSVKILIEGIEKNVYGLFYIFESKYYFIYTEKEVDDNNYVVLYMTQVGKETINTETGPVDTGYMIGVEIIDPAEQQKVQTSISYIVEDKKNNTVNPHIQYLPINMLSNLKIISKKRFRLLKSIMIDNFKVDLEPTQNNMQNMASNVVNPLEVQTAMPQPVQLSEVQTAIPQPVQLAEVQTAIPQPVQLAEVQTAMPQSAQLSEMQTAMPQSNINESVPALKNENIEGNNSVIVDYRTKYFELDEKNKELQNQVVALTEKLNEIKKVIE